MTNTQVQTMFEERTFKKKKTRAAIGMPANPFNPELQYEINPLVEAGALMAEYSSKDDGIREMWFKPTGESSCIVTINHVGKTKEAVLASARNLNIIIKNQYPGISMKLLSSRSERGKEAIETSRLLYKFLPRTKKQRAQYEKEMEEDIYSY